MHYDSALSIGRRIQSGETSSLAVTDHLLDRIGELDSELKSFVTVCADQAREAAINADQEIEGDQCRPGDRSGQTSLTTTWRSNCCERPAGYRWHYDYLRDEDPREPGAVKERVRGRSLASGRCRVAWKTQTDRGSVCSTSSFGRGAHQSMEF